MFGALRAGFEGCVISIRVFSGLLTTAKGLSGLEIRIQDFQSIQALRSEYKRSTRQTLV